MSIQESLSSKTFQLGETEFLVQDIPFAEGREIVDRVRVTLGRLSGEVINDSADPEVQMGNLLLSAVSMLSTEEMNDLQTRLFKHLEAKIPGAKAPITVLGNEELAFEGNVFNVYTAAVRCFTANFLDYFIASLPKSGTEILDSLQSKLQTSTPT